MTLQHAKVLVIKASALGQWTVSKLQKANCVSLVPKVIIHYVEECLLFSEAAATTEKCLSNSPSHCDRSNRNSARKKKKPLPDQFLYNGLHHILLNGFGTPWGEWNAQVTYKQKKKNTWIKRGVQTKYSVPNVRFQWSSRKKRTPGDRQTDRQRGALIKHDCLIFPTSKKANTGKAHSPSTSRGS